MKYFRIFSTFLLFFSCFSLSISQTEKKPAKKASVLTEKNTPKTAAKYEGYEGKWYGIMYPQGWSLRPSLKDSASGADDSVFFTSPDSLAEFYVYCPRYTGKPKDIEIDRKTENQLGQTIEEDKGVRIRTVRIQAKDSSYIRFIEDTEAFIKRRRLVFGAMFRGRDNGRTAIQKHNAAYLYFKQSFRKFTD